MDLSVILVNHNAKEITANCIQSIYDKTKSISFEVVLVDNNSSDGSEAYIRSEFPQVRLLVNDVNKGFAAANNQGIKISKGKYIILLNNDTSLKNDAFDKMFNFMEKNGAVGALTCKLYEEDGQTVQRNCRSFPLPWDTMFARASLFTKIFPRNQISRKNMYLDWDYNSAREVDWVSGAALMVRKEVISQVGLLDENFYMYWEDTDWCKRMHETGWKIYFLSEAEIIHFTGAGGTRIKGNIYHNNRMIYHKHKSAYYYFKKHHLKSWLHPMTLITYLGFIILAGLKTARNSIKMLFIK